MMQSDSYVLIGQGRWVAKLAAGLNEVGTPVHAVPLDSARAALTPRTWRAVRSAAVVLRVGFRPGAATWRGRAFDLALRTFGRRATTASYWIGTDVLKFSEDLERGTRVAAWRSPALAIDHHLAGSEPLRRELVDKGIGAVTVDFPWRTVEAPSEPPPFPTQFTVLTYVPDGRPDFYGGPTILAVARHFPDVRFEVMGGSGGWAADAPPNISFLGWVEDPARAYERATCVLRLTQHDSIGGTAVEGLLFGRPVLYTHELAHSHTVEVNVESVGSALGSLVEHWRAGTLSPDHSAASWARETFDPQRRFQGLADHLIGLRTSTRPPRISYLTLQATSEGQAAHAHVNEIIRGLARGGWSVRLLKPSYRDSSPGLAPRLLEFSRIQLRALAGLKRSDAFYVRSHFAALPAALAARWRRAQVVQEVNGPHDDALVAWPALRRIRTLVEVADRLQMRAADAVITVTPQLVEWLRADAGVDNVHLVSNGADVERFTPQENRREGLPDNYVVFFGALAPWQGIEIALDAVECAEWPEDVALVVAGDGQMRELVQERTDGRRIVYLGRRPYAEIPGIVSGSLASLLPMAASASDRGQTSTRDHTASGLAPLKMYESMACGVPVVASDLPGMADTIRDAGCGLLVTPGAAVDLAAAVRLLAEDRVEAERMGRNGRASAVSQHSWQRRADDTADVLRSVMSSSAPDRK